MTPMSTNNNLSRMPSSEQMKAPVRCVFNAVRQKTVIMAALMSVFASIIAGVVKYLDESLAGGFLELTAVDNVVYQSFSFTLGFLVIFHTSNAYQRLVKGGEMLYTVMGNFCDLAGLAMAFTRYSEAPQELQLDFKVDLVRLLSLAFCVGIGRLEEHSGEWLAHGRRLVDVAALGQDRLSVIHECPDEHKPEVVCHLIHCLVVDGVKSGVLSIPPPLLTRVYQELGDTTIKLSEIRSYKELPFPRTLVTATQFLLAIHLITTPYFMASWCEDFGAAAFWTFCIVFSMHLLHNVARELDNPFGTDLNDIDMAALQEEVNETLLSVFVASTPIEVREQTRGGCLARKYRELKRLYQEPDIITRQSPSQHSLKGTYRTWERSRSPPLSRGPTSDWDLDVKADVKSPAAEQSFEDAYDDSRVQPVHRTQPRAPRTRSKGSQGEDARVVGSSSKAGCVSSPEAQAYSEGVRDRGEQQGACPDAEGAFHPSSKSGNLSEQSGSTKPRAEGAIDRGDAPRRRTSYDDYKRRVAEATWEEGAKS